MSSPMYVDYFPRSMTGNPGWVASLLQSCQPRLVEFLLSCSLTEICLTGWGLENVGVKWSQTCLTSIPLETWLPANPQPILKGRLGHHPALEWNSYWSFSESSGNASINITVHRSFITVNGKPVPRSSKMFGPITLIEDNSHQTVSSA